MNLGILRRIGNSVVRQFRRSRTVSSIETPALEPTRPKVFMAAHVDELTRSMTRWIAAAAARIDNASLYVGDGASTSNLRRFLDDHADESVTVVFYGHGEDDCLLTTMTLGVGDLRRDGTCRSLCTADELATTRAPLLIVAYCCAAAKGLARILSSRRDDIRFLGFRDDISFSMGTPARETAFSTPMEDAVVEICKTGTIDQLMYQTLRDAYTRERARWITGGEFARDARAPFVAMYLLQHRNLLDVV